MNLEKVEVLLGWEKLTSVKEICSFLGMTGYYRRFVKGFFSLADPLTQLTKNNVKFEWNENCKRSFIELKTWLTTAPMLALPSGTS